MFQMAFREITVETSSSEAPVVLPEQRTLVMWVHSGDFGTIFTMGAQINRKNGTSSIEVICDVKAHAYDLGENLAMGLRNWIVLST